MIKIIIDNEYDEWTPNSEKLVETAGKLFDYYLSVSELSKNSCLAEYDYDLIEFDVLFTNKNQTHEINRVYREKDYPADIISFALFADSEPEERFVQDGVINLGEIIIALDKIEESAKEKAIDKEVELIFMISHGILHLLGFDHQTEQEFDFVVKYQKKALESIGIKYDKI